jgi:RimJ/RimL family protein N-acetyltransferase
MLTHKGTQTIKTERLILRRYSESDAREMFDNWANDGRVTRYLTWKPHGDIDFTKKVLTDWVGKYENMKFYNWGIELDGKLIGNIAAVRQDERSEQAEIGYCIGYDYWGKGIMTEAAGAVIDYLFGEVGFNRVSLWHSVKNPGSGRVAQKCGMTYEGTERSGFKSNDGEFLDHAHYGILKSDWEIRREIAYYSSLPVLFDGFIELSELSDGVIELACVKKSPADPVKKYVPEYSFEMRKDGISVGKINLRIGYPESLYYGGQIGYYVDEVHRGNGYAGHACKLLIPVMKAHGMGKVLISNDHQNTASRRVCEKLGARFLHTAEIPEWHEMYKEGKRLENIFEWAVD